MPLRKLSSFPLLVIDSTTEVIGTHEQDGFRVNGKYNIGEKFAEIEDKHVKKAGDTMTGKLTINNSLDISGSASIAGSITNLAKGGGIYWTPYMESATDGSDAASITVNTSSGNTTMVLRLMNDSGDGIRFETPAGSDLKHKMGSDTGKIWTELNDGSGSKLDADLIDGLHLSRFYKHGFAYPYGKTDRPWHLVALAYIEKGASELINTSISLYVAEFYYAKSYGILNVRSRWEGNKTTPSWFTGSFSLSNNINTDDFKLSYKTVDTSHIYLNLYIRRTGWTSYAITKIEELAWGAPHDEWTLIAADRSTGSTNNTFTEIPSDETTFDVEKLTIDNSVTGNASTATALTSSAGSATLPIYFKEGKPVATTYSLGKSVPSDAVFTDTNTKVTSVGNHYQNTVSDSTSSATPSHGGTFTVIDTVTRDAAGHVTGVNTKTVTLPADNNTDTKVTQTAVTASSYTNWRPLVFGNNSSATEGFTPNTTTDGVLTVQTLSCQPSSGSIRAKKYKYDSNVETFFDSTDKCLKINFL